MPGRPCRLHCRDRFKIRITTRSLRALVAAKEIAEATPFTTKSGPDVDNPHNPSLHRPGSDGRRRSARA